MRLLSEFAAWFTIHGDLLPHQGMCLDDRRYSSLKETTMSQMKIADRNRIEFLIALGWPLPLKPVTKRRSVCLEPVSIRLTTTSER